MMRKFGLVVACALAFVVLDAGLAGAHVTVSPSSLPQGTNDAILTFRVPNESATAAVTGLKIQFPLTHPIVLLNPEAGSGWQVQVVKAALPRPITTDDGTFTSTVSEIDWSGGASPSASSASSTCWRKASRPARPSSPSRRSRRMPTARSCRGSRSRTRRCQIRRTPHRP